MEAIHRLPHASKYATLDQMAHEISFQIWASWHVGQLDVDYMIPLPIRKVLISKGYTLQPANNSDNLDGRTTIFWSKYNRDHDRLPLSGMMIPYDSRHNRVAKDSFPSDHNFVPSNQRNNTCGCYADTDSILSNHPEDSTDSSELDEEYDETSSEIVDHFDWPEPTQTMNIDTLRTLTKNLTRQLYEEDCELKEIAPYKQVNP